VCRGFLSSKPDENGREHGLKCLLGILLAPRPGQRDIPLYRVARFRSIVGLAAMRRA
jgi:hypothetical protein